MAGLALQIRWAALFEGDPRWPLLLAMAVVGGIGLFLRGFRAWRALRLIQDTPTAKVRSLALGRVELRGRALGKGELLAPLTGSPCVWYRWRVEERARSGRQRGWRTRDHGSSEAWPFYLEDETGRVLVDPRGAEVDAELDFRETGPASWGPAAGFLAERGIGGAGLFGERPLRLSEWRIAPGDRLYVLGVAGERAGLARERRERIRARLAALKSDPDAMAHLDADGDGRISADEWEVARRLVVAEAATDAVEDRIAVARGDHGEPFYVCDGFEPAVLRRYRWRAWGGVFGGAGLALVGLAGLLHRVGALGR